ncbi:MAG: helix-turn-helix domain-containing protein [Gemmatimonadetes bacterium]|nr:helix-turn-helix domain-containing protein [Gemmatimonadota bacterium]
MNLTLSVRRKEAGLTQSDLARILGITQGQVSNYETGGEIPSRLLIRWSRAIGCTVEDLLTDYQPVDEKQIFDFDSRLYGSLIEDLNLLLRYIELSPYREVPYVKQFQDCVISLKEKPWVVIMGHFDVGKSHLCNFYLGGNMLPTGYQPVTKFPTFIRHISDRPDDWFQEDLWLMGSQFEPERWRDQQHCEQHRILAGSWDTLERHATLKGNKENSEEGYVLVFGDAPLLHSCVLVDMPGYADNMTNASIIDRLGRRADILLYLCRAQGFLDSGDFVRLGHFLSKLPRYKDIDNNFPILGNLFIIATHAHPGISSEQLEKQILEGGSEAFYELFLAMLRSREQLIKSMDIRKRFFSFYQEIPGRREDLEENLKLLLGEHMLSVWRKRASRKILDFKEKGIKIYKKKKEKYEENLKIIETVRNAIPDEEKEHIQVVRTPEIQDKDIESIEVVLTPEIKEEILKKIEETKTIPGEEKKLIEVELTSVKEKEILREKTLRLGEIERVEVKSISANQAEPLGYKILKKEVDKRKPITNAEVELIEREILTLLNEDIRNLRHIFQKKLQVKNLIKMINGLYKSTEKKKAQQQATTHVLQEILAETEEFRTAALFQRVRPLIEEYDIKIGNLDNVGIVESSLPFEDEELLVGIGTFTALNAAFILLGGPILLVVGTSAALAVSTAWIFGDLWPRRLARKISHVFRKEVLVKIEQDIIKPFWDNILKDIKKSIDELNKEREQYIEELNNIIKNSQEVCQDSEEKLQHYEHIRTFFAGIPWQQEEERKKKVKEQTDELRKVISSSEFREFISSRQK